jgi:hypothetical protein
MLNLMYLIISAAMLADYLSSLDIGFIPGVVKFLPDLLAAVTVVYVAAAGTRQRFRYVNMKYWLIFGAIGVVMVCGPIVNHESPGPMVAGMRYYLRALPFFFLPAIVNFSDRDIQRYMNVIFGFALLQSPVAVSQRVASEAKGWFTGDYVYGTLMISGILSLFLIAVLCVMAALMLRGRFRKIWFAVCFIVLVIPMSINETKVTVFLLPLGLLATFVLASPPEHRVRGTLSALGLLIIASAIFVPLYDYLNTLHNPEPFTIEDFLTGQGKMGRYVENDAGVGTGKEAGRADALIVPFKELSRDPIKFTFGLGLGNASKSSLGSQFSGRYQTLYWNYVMEESASAFLFELGFLGTSLILLLHWLLLRDAFFVAKHDHGLIGILAPGYVGAWIIITIGLFYLTIHVFVSLSFMFWFFSGLIAARRERLAVGRVPARRPLPATFEASNLKT